MWAFQFDHGGSLKLNITLDNTLSVLQPNHSIQYMFVNDAEIAPLKTARFSDVCSTFNFDFVQTEFLQRLGAVPYDQFVSYENNSTEKTWLYLLQLNCEEEEMSGYLDYIAMNPGGEYLSLSEVPYKKLTVGLSVGNN